AHVAAHRARSRWSSSVSVPPRRMVMNRGSRSFGRITVPPYGRAGRWRAPPPDWPWRATWASPTPGCCWCTTVCRPVHDLFVAVRRPAGTRRSSTPTTSPPGRTVTTTPTGSPGAPPGTPGTPEGRRGPRRALLVLAVLVVLAAGAGLFVVLSGDDGSSPDDEAETAAETRAGDEPAADEGARAEGTDEADGGGPAGASADLPDAELTALIDSVMFDEGEIGM